MYSDERLQSPTAFQPEIVEDDDDDELPVPEALEYEVPRPVRQPPARSVAPALSEADQQGLSFWKELNEAEQRWITTAGPLAIRLVKWASRLSHSPKILKIRIYTGAGEDRRFLQTSSYRYVAVEVQPLVVLFTLAPEELPPEFDLGAKVDVEFDGQPPQPLLFGWASNADKFPFPGLVFFPDDAQS